MNICYRVTKRDKYSEERMEKMYSYPASIDLALIHKKANQFGYIRKLVEG
jgi:hypothetical protein